jgi:hypothetical protein
VDPARAFEPTTGRMRKIAECAPEFRACIEAYEVDADGRLTKLKLRDSLRALENLAKHLNAGWSAAGDGSFLRTQQTIVLVDTVSSNIIV